MSASPDCILQADADDFSVAKAAEILEDTGYVILRGLFSKSKIENALQRIREVSAKPAIAGTSGYIKVDHPKKFIEPFLSGPEFYGLTLNETVLDVIEERMNGECVLAEGLIKVDEPTDYTYFDMHTDFSVGWKKSPDSPTSLSAEDMKKPIGIGCIVYFHDTASGAFRYCAGSHKLAAPHGQDLARYPEDEKQAILATNTRLDGKAGDVVLFDDRGFHGPDQPSTAQRTVLLLDFYSVDVFGFVQVSPVPVLTSYLNGLNDRQKRVLGLGSGFMVPPDERHTNRFRSNALFPLIDRMIGMAYLKPHLKNRIKSIIRPGQG